MQSPKRICNQCLHEFIPEGHQLTVVVSDEGITIRQRHLDSEPEFCSRDCRMEFVVLAEMHIGKRVAEVEELDRLASVPYSSSRPVKVVSIPYSSSRLERMVKE